MQHELPILRFHAELKEESREFIAQKTAISIKNSKPISNHPPSRPPKTTNKISILLVFKKNYHE
jgi:hypothetical protein